jgi:hypothetical protein
MEKSVSNDVISDAEVYTVKNLPLHLSAEGQVMEAENSKINEYKAYDYGFYQNFPEFSGKIFSSAVGYRLCKNTLYSVKRIVWLSSSRVGGPV